jgi:hypothetical protein
MEDIYKLCNKYDIIPVEDNITCLHAMGIGDILFAFILHNNNLIKTNLYFNIKYFRESSFYYINQLNALEFRLKLIKKIITDNIFDTNIYKFLLSDNTIYTQPTQYLQFIKTFKLNLNTSHIHLSENILSYLNDNKYIIFHTKCRFVKSTNYEYIKDIVKQFAKSLVSQYKILILGEKNPPNTDESKMHNMQTVYNELIYLKENNDILDLTNDNFDILDFDQYITDVKLIQNAEYNISFGLGGSLSTSIAFSKKTYFLCCPEMSYIHLNTEYARLNNVYQFNNLNEMTQQLNTDLSKPL